MSSKKRVSAFPASVAGLKHQRSSCENEDLQCLICLELVVDATQVACCGALHCRACISQCTTCPNCRKRVSDINIVPDIRCERLSAAARRPCTYAEDGCVFEGNRASVIAHEDTCDFVPFSVLREQIKRVTREKNQETARISCLSAEKEDMQKELLKCALGPEPAENVLRFLYKLPPNHLVAQVSRTESRGQSYSPLCWIFRAISFRIHESHHNVAVWFVKDQNADQMHPNSYPAVWVRVKLLHPYDATKVKSISIQLSDLNEKQQVGCANFMTSTELDEFCVNGKYYLA